jgi:PAS domain S-box-containing protein
LQYQEERRRSQALSKSEQALEKLSANTRKLPAGGCPEEALGHIAAAIRDITPFQTITYSLYEPERGVLRQLANAEVQAAEEAPMAAELHWTDVQELLRDERRAGYAYLVPGELSEDELPDGADRGEARNCWLLPLFNDDDQPLGLMRLETPRDVRPDGAASEALELLAAEARLVMAAARRSEALQQRVEDLEAERARMQAALEESRAVLPALVEKGSEQARAIQRLSQQARRVRDGLEIAELANRQADAHAVLATLAREILARNRLDAALIAEEAPGGPRLVEVIGETPPQAANLEALFGQRNPLRQSFQDGEVQLVAKLPEPIDTQTSPLLAALGARSLICLPVYRGEQVAASILAVGREEMPDFSKEDGQVYHQLARQSAIILQNLNLLTETRQHLHEVNLMLEFGRQLGSLDAASILKTLVESALRLMPQASAGMVAVWDAKTGRLVPQAALGFADTDSVLAIQYAPGEALPGQAFSSGQTLRVDEVDFARDYNLPAEDLLRYRRAAGGLLPLSTLLVPIRAGEMGLGLLELDCFSETGAFNDENEALAGSLAQQTALALENARLFQAAEERAGQLQALNSVAAGLSSSLQSEQMIAGLLGQLKTIVQFDTGTLWLRTGEELTVAAASGFADSEQRLGITAAVDDSQLFKAMTSSGTAVAVADVRADHRFPVLAETERLAWAGIPLVAKNEVVGVIALEKTEADYYNPERLRLASTFASQAAVALENARLYEESLRRTAELDRRAQRLALLNRLSGELSSSLELERILRTAAQELLQALGGSSAAVILFGEDNAPLLVVDEPPSGPGVPPVIADTPVFERMRQTLGILSFYDVQGVGELTPLSVFFQAHDARALLALPLITGAALNGVLFLMSTSPNRFNSSEIELGRTIANQAAIAAQNARLFAETRRLTEDLEQRVRERTAELTAEHHNTQTLLRIITELSASLDIDQVLNRTLGVLNESTGAVSSAILLSKPEELQVDYRAGSCGQDTEGGEQSTVRAELVIAAAVIKKRQALLVEDLAADPVWREAAPSVSAGQSLIGVPLVLGEEILGALVLRRGEALPFTRQQTTLTEAAARQISIALNNASLFNLIRDQAERLGGMLRDQQIEASRSRAILEAVADGVLVTDANNQITLFNASAGKILKLEAGQVLGQSLDRLMGLFGRAGRAWSSTIREWSQNADQERSNETYAERITLEDGRVVAVHLAPVFMRSELLGTVSIFRDVTHEVQVDRLKSEFVANVSHELRTPMTSIKGYVEILLMGAAGELSERQKRFLQIVKNNTERLTILVNDLLDVSRIEAGRVRLSQQALALAEIVQEAADYIGQRSREEDKPMAVVLELPGGLPRVWGDRERVQQIVDNLVGNAYNYTPPGGRILVRLQRRGGEVRVDVVDSGVGIPLEDQPRIFERFFRGDDPLVLATAGTGLGLSITRTLVEMHRGRIWFESRGIPGEGSCFTFTLPVYEGEG